MCVRTDGREERTPRNKIECKESNAIDKTREVACVRWAARRLCGTTKNSTIPPTRHPAPSIHAQGMCGGVVARLGLCVSLQGPCRGGANQRQCRQSTANLNPPLAIIIIQAKSRDQRGGSRRL